MSMNYYPIKEEFEINLTVKVRLNSIANYFRMTDENKKDAVEEIKKELPNILKETISKHYQQSEIGNIADYADFEVF